jgi:predicted MPP superfamily phosphohydrolase
MGSLETELQQTLNREKPDLILIAGDTLDSDLSLSVARELFAQIKPKMGILATPGNWENWKDLSSPSLFRSFGVTLLKNERYQFNEGLSVLGFDDFSGELNTDISQSKPESKLCIALIHSPVVFETINGICPLVLAGHTHGGQIRLPFLNPLWLPKGSGKYVSGWYKEKDSQLYVSRGIGTSILPLRFFSSPELVLITLKDKT